MVSGSSDYYDIAYGADYEARQVARAQVARRIIHEDDRLRRQAQSLQSRPVGGRG